MNFIPLNDPKSERRLAKYKKKFVPDHPGYVLGNDGSSINNTCNNHNNHVRVQAFLEAQQKRQSLN